MIECIREKFTEHDADKVNLLCVCALAVTDYTRYDASTNTVIGYAGPQFWYEGTITGNRGGTIQTKGTVLGRLTGNYNLNGDHEVRLFCPQWARDGAPIYFVKVNPNYTPTGWLFMTDTDALKTPRGVYRDYGSRSGFHFFFPYTDIDYKNFCYNHDFTVIGDYDEVLQYFGGANWETLWNIEYTDSMKMFGADKNNLGIPTYWAGKNYNPTPQNLFPESYYNLDSTKNYIYARCEAYWGGKPLKQNIGVCYSSTNTTPTPTGVGCTVLLTANNASPFSFESKIPATPSTLYYLRFFMILEDDTLKMGPIVSIATKGIGKKPTLQPQRILVKDTSATFYMRAVDEDSPITSHGIRVGASPSTMVSVPIVDTYWASDRYFSAKLTGLIKNKNYYIQAWATNAEGETVSSAYYTNPLTASLNTSGFFTTLGEATVPNVGLSLAQNVTTNSASVEGFIHDTGGRTVTEWGFVSSTKTKLPTETFFEIKESAIAEINDSNEMLSYVITSLVPGSKYFMRFYAKNSIGIDYSETVEINTLPGIKVTTKSLTNISKTGAMSGGSVTGESETITGRGVCWGTLPMPTIANSTKASGKGIGTFDAALSGLTALTRYFVRAFATTATGTTYGDEKQFTTAVDVQPDAPKVSTLKPQVADTFVIAGVTVLDEGTQGIVNQGIVVSLIPDPENLDDVEFYKEGNADSPIQINELEKDTDYYVIAYAENAIGFSFGEPLAVKTIGDLAAQPFPVDISLESLFFTKDVSGKTINKVTATIDCDEPNIKEYGIRWTTDYLRYIDPEFNWAMAKNKSTQPVMDIWDMPASMPIYYFGYAITDAGVESRSVGKQINLPAEGGTVDPNDPPIVPPVVIPTTGTFAPPADAVIGDDYKLGNKRWIKTSEGWERDYTYTGSAQYAAPENVSGIVAFENAQKADLFEVSNTKKMVVTQIEITTILSEGMPQVTTGYQIDFYVKESVKFDNNEDIKIVFGSNEITDLVAIVDNGNNLFCTIIPLAREAEVTLLANAIENSSDIIQIISLNAVNVELVVPTQSKKVPMQSIHGEENKLNKNWNPITTVYDLDRTVADGLYHVNLAAGDYGPFGNSEFTLMVTESIDTDWASQIAIYYSNGKRRMAFRTLSSGNAEPEYPYGWEELETVDYMVLVALASQVGTNAPTFQVIKNTIGDIQWAYGGAGTFSGTLEGAFKGNVVFIQKSQVYINGNDTASFMILEKNGDDIITLYTNLLSTISTANGCLDNTLIEIRVYN